MNLMQNEDTIPANAFVSSPKSCFVNYREHGVSINDQKNKPRHYENSEDGVGDLTPQSDSQLHLNLDGDLETKIWLPIIEENSDIEEEKFSVSDEILQSFNTSNKIVPKITKREAGESQMLQFSNPSSSFATRCDVVYKTLLRDCRKYFTDALQMKNMRKSKKLSNIGRILDEFVRSKFSNYNESSIHQLKFYLGWLVYPKEMISSKIGLVDEDNKMLKGSERNTQIKRIRDLHTFLYNFSMQRWEEFFEIVPLALLFKEYNESIEERFMISNTMNRNREAYETALGLIKAKINHTIQNLI